MERHLNRGHGQIKKSSVTCTNEVGGQFVCVCVCWLVTKRF